MIAFTLTRPRLGPDFTASLTTDDESVTPIELNWVDESDNQLVDEVGNTIIFLDYV